MMEKIKSKKSELQINIFFIIFLVCFLVIFIVFFLDNFINLKNKDIDMNDKLSNYQKNNIMANFSKPNGSLDIPKKNIKQSSNIHMSERIVNIDKLNNEFCVYQEQAEKCFNISVYNNTFNNYGILKNKDYYIVMDYNFNPVTTFIINDHLKQKPRIMVIGKDKVGVKSS